MFAFLPNPRKAASRLFALLSLVWLAACDPTALIPQTGEGGPKVDTNAPVQVAFLVPGGSGEGSDSFLAKNLENAARLAISDLNGATIDLRVYNTGADPAQAAQIATAAVNDGAKIILGPLFADAANAAGVAVAGRNVNVLAFSNNPTIAGGNVFILGPTFTNTANRLVQYAGRQGINRFAIVHGQNLSGEFGRDAIANAARANGAQIASVNAYPLSQQGISLAAAEISRTAKAGGATAAFFTGVPAGDGADLPFILPAVVSAGLSPSTTQFMGLTRWDANPQLLALPSAQGGVFTMPDTGMAANFSARYAAAYGDQPHPLAGLAYDGIAAIGALVASGNHGTLTKQALTSPQGFQGTAGIFRLLPNGLNERGLAIATVRNNQVVVIEPAPRSFGRAGL